MARRTTTQQPQYARRLVLFIDFLGFKETVEQTVRDPDALRRLIKALREIRKIDDDGASGDHIVTQFSDSIVVSYRVTERSGVFWLLNSIALAVIELTNFGYLLRGAVTVGDLYHTSDHVVGPAMVRAYQMESKEAKYPRVIVDPEVISSARHYRSELHLPEEEEAYVRRFLTPDDDGRLFVNYISWESVVEVAGIDDDQYPRYLAQISKHLDTGLGHQDPRVLEKYLWLHGRYAQARQAFVDLPADHNYRTQSPEACHAIERLPTHASAATKARKRVELYQEQSEAEQRALEEVRSRFTPRSP